VHTGAADVPKALSKKIEFCILTHDETLRACWSNPFRTFKVNIFHKTFELIFLLRNKEVKIFPALQKFGRQDFSPNHLSPGRVPEGLLVVNCTNCNNLYQM